MRTPSFKLDQTDDTLQITIKAPFANVAQTEIDVNETEFIFSSWPYFLRLHLPGPIEETDSSKGKYDFDTGSFYFELSKKNRNEFFPHLDLIGSFLAPKTNKPLVKPKIEVLSSVSNGCDNDESENSDEEEDWLMEQTLPEESEALLPTIGEYGFANQTKGVLHKFPSEELAEILDLLNPDEVSAGEKKEKQLLKEQDDFSEDHYLADFMDPPEVLETFLSAVPDWTHNELSKEHLELLKDLGNKEYLLSKQEEKSVFFSLVDILFGFAYDHRTTNGTPSTESAWTINKLSATLSWLRSFTSLKEVTVSCVRRSVCYPLYRNWDLSLVVLKDVINILTSGQTQIVKCLLTVYSLFLESEPRYLLNQLYIKDYIIWVQKVPDAKLASFRSSLELLELEKSDIGLELKELEYAAHLTQQADEEAVVNNMVNLHLDHGETSSSAYDSSSDSESTSSSLNDFSSDSESTESDSSVDSDDYTSSEEVD
nr:PREDICTED: protein SHQ1 homolog [Bemisia tabaci]XP_018911114.1 PREDICTED: protein SHQ1 homolog [Bemisia tabaci]